MGNDGGSIPTRRELVKEAARNPTTSQIKESQAEQQEYLWTTDPVTQKPLAQPIVSDAYGKLYNKDTVLEYLLDASRKDDFERVTLGNVHSLKDIVELKFHSGTQGDKSKQTQWTCPITEDKLGPGSKAVYIVPCGHVFSAAALRAVSGDICLTCETPYAANDVITIVPVAEDDIAKLTLRLKTLQEKGLTHSLKKASSGKKRKKHVSEEDVPDKEPLKDAHSGINNASTASTTTKVLQAQDQAKRRRHDTENVKSLFTNNKDSGKMNGKKNDFMTRGFDVPVASRR